MRVVLDTNVLVAALRSPLGASARLLQQLPSSRWTPVISVPLYCEYRDVLLRPGMVSNVLTPQDILAFCRFIAAMSLEQPIYYLWRPCLPDPKDDHLLELAFAAKASYLVTHNVKDFRGTNQFGVVSLTPADFLRLLKP
jgi:putative PIN family toxin of toxin-antitoxin system